MIKETIAKEKRRLPAYRNPDHPACGGWSSAPAGSSGRLALAGAFAGVLSSCGSPAKDKLSAASTNSAQTLAMLITQMGVPTSTGVNPFALAARNSQHHPLAHHRVHRLAQRHSHRRLHLAHPPPAARDVPRSHADHQPDLAADRDTLESMQRRGIRRGRRPCPAIRGSHGQRHLRLHLGNPQRRRVHLVSKLLSILLLRRAHGRPGYCGLPRRSSRPTITCS